jgi:hypothetical protein
MRFRLGLFIGAAVGYVLGAKAGRERYEQIVAAANKVRTNESVIKAVTSAEQSTRRPRSIVGAGMVRVARAIRVKADPHPETAPDQPDSR